MVPTIKTVSYWICYFWKTFHRLDPAMPFLSLPELKFGRFLRALKPCILHHETYWHKSASKRTTTWFFFSLWFIDKIRKAHFIVHFILGMNCPSEGQNVAVSQYISGVNLYRKDMFTAICFDHLWLLTWLRCNVLLTWLTALDGWVSVLSWVHGLFSELPASNVLLVFRMVAHPLSLILPAWLRRTSELNRSSEHQTRPSGSHRIENWVSKSSATEPLWVSAILVLLKPPSWCGSVTPTVFHRICCHQLFFAYGLLYFINVEVGWTD